jgi:hypothetical protein
VRCLCPLWVKSRHADYSFICVSNLTPTECTHGIGFALIKVPEALAMLHRFGFNRCCEIAGRTSAVVAFVAMASLILAATAADLLLY